MENRSFTYQEKEAYFTAVLELGDMFDGGGVPIDHYIIQVDNGTQLETPGPTYSFDIMYNTTLSVNISAHNCAGYSDPFALEIKYDQGGVSYIPHSLLIFIFVICIHTDISSSNIPPGPNSGLSMWKLAVLTGIGGFLLVLTTLVTVLSLYLIRRHSQLRELIFSCNLSILVFSGSRRNTSVPTNIRYTRNLWLLTKMILFIEWFTLGIILGLTFTAILELQHQPLHLWNTPMSRYESGLLSL